MPHEVRIAFGPVDVLIGLAVLPESQNEPLRRVLRDIRGLAFDDDRQRVLKHRKRLVEARNCLAEGELLVDHACRVGVDGQRACGEDQRCAGQRQRERENGEGIAYDGFDPDMEQVLRGGLQWSTGHVGRDPYVISAIAATDSRRVSLSRARAATILAA